MTSPLLSDNYDEVEIGKGRSPSNGYNGTTCTQAILDESKTWVVGGWISVAFWANCTETMIIFLTGKNLKGNNNNNNNNNNVLQFESPGIL
jgi:hypothetical protein